MIGVAAGKASDGVVREIKTRAGAGDGSCLALRLALCLALCLRDVRLCLVLPAGPDLGPALVAAVLKCSCWVKSTALAGPMGR